MHERIPCAGCGYDIRGLDPNGRCPECGIPIDTRPVDLASRAYAVASITFTALSLLCVLTITFAFGGFIFAIVGACFAADAGAVRSTHRQDPRYRRMAKLAMYVNAGTLTLGIAIVGAAVINAIIA